MTHRATIRPRVIYDLDHPDFPHGETVGYSRGCKRECCLRAERRRDALRELDRSRGIPAPPRTVAAHLVKQAQRHVTDLMHNHGASAGEIGKAAGIGLATVLKVLHGKPVSQRTFDRVMTVKPGTVSRRDHTDADATVLRTGQMLALGYPMRWQEAQIGMCRGGLVALLGKVRRGDQKWVEPATAERVAALAARIGDQAADPTRDGIPARDVARAKSVARRHGYYPPAAYDENGELDWRAIPDHPWAIADEWCHTRIEDLRVVIANPDLGSAGLASLVLDSDEQTAEHETLDKRFDRVLKRFDLRASVPGSAERRAELENAVWRFYRRNDKTPVAFVLDYGLIDVKHAREIPRDHPDLIEHPLFVEWQKEREANRKATRQRTNEREKQQRRAARAARAAEQSQVAA